MSKYLGLVLGIAGLVSAIGLSADNAYAADETRQEEPVGQPEYYVDDIKSTMMKHIAATVDEEGVFRMLDDKTGEELALKFVRIHDPVRQIDSHYDRCPPTGLIVLEHEPHNTRWRHQLRLGR